MAKPKGRPGQLKATALKSRDGRIRRVRIGQTIVEVAGPPVAAVIDGRQIVTLAIVDPDIDSDVDHIQDRLDDEAEKAARATSGLLR